MKIEWNGGEMPVPEGTPIRVWYRNGNREPMDCEAGGIFASDWTHDPKRGSRKSENDIVAYEVLEPAVTPVEPRTQWEYTLEVMPRGTVGEIRDYLNFFGADGWELCCTDYGHLIFKRQKS